MDSLGRHLEGAGCVVATAWAEPLDGGAGVGFDEDLAVTPASTIKVPVAQAALNAVATDAVARLRA